MDIQKINTLKNNGFDFASISLQPLHRLEIHHDATMECQKNNALNELPNDSFNSFSNVDTFERFLWKFVTVFYNETKG